MLAVGDVGEVGVDLVEHEQVDGGVAEGCGVGGVEDGGAGVGGGEGVGVGDVEGGDALLDAVLVDGEILGGEAEDGLALGVDDGGVEQDEAGGDREGVGGLGAGSGEERGGEKKRA